METRNADGTCGAAQAGPPDLGDAGQEELAAAKASALLAAANGGRERCVWNHHPPSPPHRLVLRSSPEAALNFRAFPRRAVAALLRGGTSLPPLRLFPRVKRCLGQQIIDAAATGDDSRLTSALLVRPFLARPRDIRLTRSPSRVQAGAADLDEAEQLELAATKSAALVIAVNRGHEQCGLSRSHFFAFFRWWPQARG